jgi:hypothetical protein
LSTRTRFAPIDVTLPVKWPCSLMTRTFSCTWTLEIRRRRNTFGGALLSPAAALVNYAVNYGTATFTIVMPPAPTVSAAANPNMLLWSPNKTMVPVTVSGIAAGSGVTSIAYSVADEYKKVQPSGTAPVDAAGRYSFVVNLEAYRNGTDADGRFYTITVTAQDRFGRVVSTTTIVRVPHDQQ